MHGRPEIVILLSTWLSSTLSSGCRRCLGFTAARVRRDATDHWLGFMWAKYKTIRYATSGFTGYAKGPGSGKSSGDADGNNNVQSEDEIDPDQ